MTFLAVLLNAGLAEMSSVGKVVKRVSRSSTLAILHGLALVDVASLARAKFLAGLMGMATVAFRMGGETRLDELSVKTMAKIAFGNRGTGRHL